MKTRIKLWAARLLVRHLRARNLYLIGDSDVAAVIAEGVEAAGRRVIPAAVARCLQDIGLEATVDEYGVVHVRAPGTWAPPTTIRPMQTPEIKA